MLYNPVLVVGIDGLPFAAECLRNSCMYALVEEARVPGLGLAWTLMHKTLEAGYQGVLVTPHNPALLWQKSSPAAQRVIAGIEEGAVRVFEWDPRTDRLPRQRVIDRLLAELEHFDVARCALVVIEGLEELLAELPGPQRAATLERLQAWVRHSEHGLVLVCTQKEAAPSVMATLDDYMAYFEGMAQLGVTAGEVTWTVFHWFASHGLLAQRVFPLDVDEEGLLRVRAEPQTTPAATDVSASLERNLLPDRDVVLATANVVPPGDTAPLAWQLCADYGALRGMASDAVGATVILGLADRTELDALNTLVFDLRRNAGNHLRIIVREVRVGLRYGEELLLYRMGANLVVPESVNYYRFLAQVDMLKDQVFTPRRVDEIDETLARAEQISGRGYLPPMSFAWSVLGFLERSRTLVMQNTLVKLKVASGLTVLDALRECSIARNGDICTADAEHLYLFLYACRESNVDGTLARIFRLPVDVLFVDEYRWFSPDDQQDELGRLAGMAADLTDHSEALAQHQHAAVVAVATDGASAVVRPRAEHQPIPLASPVEQPMTQAVPGLERGAGDPSAEPVAEPVVSESVVMWTAEEPVVPAADAVPVESDLSGESAVQGESAVSLAPMDGPADNPAAVTPDARPLPLAVSTSPRRAGTEQQVWQQRPLSPCYPLVLFDRLEARVNDARRADRDVLVAHAVTLDGRRDILGVWVCQPGDVECWRVVYADLQARGVDDLLMICTAAPIGDVHSACEERFPDVLLLPCLVQLLRESLDYVAWKHRSDVGAALRLIQQAGSADAAAAALSAFRAQWDEAYPLVGQLWQRHLPALDPYFALPDDVRRLVATANTMEAVHVALRKVLRARASAPSEDALYRLLWRELRHVHDKWDVPVRGWRAVLARLVTCFGERVPKI